MANSIKFKKGGVLNYLACNATQISTGSTSTFDDNDNDGNGKANPATPHHRAATTTTTVTANE
jgi:hypothetical protein